MADTPADIKRLIAALPRDQIAALPRDLSVPLIRVIEAMNAARMGMSADGRWTLTIDEADRELLDHEKLEALLARIEQWTAEH
jgi:hypothetical protein